jgi:hypothetical protein
MISEIAGAKEKMFSNDPKGNPFTMVNLKKRSTKSLETLHIKTMEDFRIWTQEQEKIANLPKDPSTLLALQAGLISEEEAKEKEMAKKKEEKKTKEEAPFEVTPRIALQALAETVWEVGDRPNLGPVEDGGLTEDQIELELKENIGLLAPEDQASVEGMKHGEEIWAFLTGIKGEAEPKREKKEGKKAGKKEGKKGGKKGERKVGISAMSVVRETVTSNPKVNIDDIKKALEKNGVSCADVSLKLEWKKTLKKLEAAA